MVSIIMSTYNGTTYLEEQLDSIRLQTRQADEVVISDDCSKDPVSYTHLDVYKRQVDSDLCVVYDVDDDFLFFRESVDGISEPLDQFPAFLRKKGCGSVWIFIVGSVYPDDRKRRIRKRIGNVFLSGLFLYESGAAVWNCPAWHYFDHLQCDRFFRDQKEQLGAALDPCGCGGAVYDRASYDGYFL